MVAKYHTVPVSFCERKEKIRVVPNGNVTTHSSSLKRFIISKNMIMIHFDNLLASSNRLCYKSFKFKHVDSFILMQILKRKNRVVTMCAPLL